jgi:hypothetical protein
VNSEARCQREGVVAVSLADETDVKADSIMSARRDLHDRTLSKLSVPLERLVYLASLRDYSSGRYFHDGLTMRFSEKVAAEAMKQEHMEVFHELAHTSLQTLVRQLNRYLDSLQEDRTESLRTWECLEPYRVVVPVGADGLAIGVFLSNIRIAVAILVMQQQSLLQPIEDT